MFAALAVPNFRLHLAGQAVNLTGKWMQVADCPVTVIPEPPAIGPTT
jgi:hypothetical protein